ncbi:MAG: divalent metal cation transporter, partial [Acidobacteria bacterium]|nr:divalent metal cation transporter [Acidobacteriota bacterium]
DIAAGMVFASLITYFIMLSTAATLFTTGKTEISTAAQAAQALVPIAGKMAGILFTIGVVSVGFIAVPIMTTGAAYAVCQALGWRQGLHYQPQEVKRFSAVILVSTAIAMSLNFLGINPMKALVWSSMAQGLSAPIFMWLVMRITNNRKIMGTWVNTRPLNALGWITTMAMFAAAVGLFTSWLI